jgi:hypothetical protein
MEIPVITGGCNFPDDARTKSSSRLSRSIQIASTVDGDAALGVDTVICGLALGVGDWPAKVVKIDIGTALCDLPNNALAVRPSIGSRAEHIPVAVKGDAAIGATAVWATFPVCIGDGSAKVVEVNVIPCLRNLPNVSVVTTVCSPAAGSAVGISGTVQSDR